MTRAKVLIVVLAGCTLAAGLVWAVSCPCGTLPGFALRGDAHEQPVRDWRFANDVPLCQIEIAVGWRPHSVNVNCMATPDGELYLSCSFGARKYWCPRVGANHLGRLRLDGIVYPVALSRVTEPTELDQAWAARVQKLQNPLVQRVQPAGVAPPPDAPRPDSWWSFRVESARTP
jgi:hypothetical protein